MPIEEIFYLHAELQLIYKMSIRLPNAELLLIDELKDNSGDRWCILASTSIRPQLRSELRTYADMPKQFCSMVNLKREKV